MQSIQFNQFIHRIQWINQSINQCAHAHTQQAPKGKAPQPPTKPAVPKKINPNQELLAQQRQQALEVRFMLFFLIDDSIDIRWLVWSVVVVLLD
jgi:hypothetical protein